MSLLKNLKKAVSLPIKKSVIATKSCKTLIEKKNRKPKINSNKIKIKIENFNSLSLISTIIEPGIFSINEKKYVITTAINNITNPLIRVNIIL